MPFDLLIRGGTVVREARTERMDIAVEDEKIVEIASEIPGDARETIDAAELHIFPGVIDPHVHFNEPGRTEWEGFASGSAAFAAGGGTLFFDMPLNSAPPVLDGPSFDRKLEAAQKSSLTDFALWGGLTPKNLDHMEELAQRGVVGFKAFMCDSGIEEFPYCDDLTLLRGMDKAAKLRLVVAVHAENQTIVSMLAAESQLARRTTMLDYIHSRPAIAEVEAIRRAITFARETGCDLHIVHVSSEAGAREAQRAVADGCSYETCPHYILLNEEDAVRLGAFAKCAPPLRSAADNEHLRFLLSTDEISFVASDHSPALPEMKAHANFFQVWGGIAGVQSTLAAMTSLHPPLGPNQIARLTATNAARRFNLAGKGKVARGFDADLTLVDLRQTYVLTREHLLDRHKLSPYVGRTFRGRICRTILRGHMIFQDGKTVGPPRGRLVVPDRST